MLVTSIFSFSHNVFLPFTKTESIIWATFFFVCKYFQFGLVLKLYCLVEFESLKFLEYIKKKKKKFN